MQETNRQAGIQREITTRKSSWFYTSEFKYWEGVMEREKNIFTDFKKKTLFYWKTGKEKIV